MARKAAYDNEKMTVLVIDDRGVFRSGKEVLYLPQPKEGRAQCVLRAGDDYQRPFDSEEALRDVVEHAASLPGARFDAEDVIAWGLDTTVPKKADLILNKPRGKIKYYDWLGPGEF